tara:strand:- start:1413 stop:2588 length:1176 start_codon:yes stop_codon:yes gene_type:complete
MINNHNQPFAEKKIFLLFSILFLSSCSSMESLKFWENDELDIDAPKELTSFSEKKTIISNWKISFDGNNDLGNFIPTFNGADLFFSDSSGVIKSINSDSGSINWEIQSNFLSTGTASGFGILVVADVDGNVMALNQEDGFLLWSKNVMGEVLSPPAIDAQFVIVKTGSGELLALDKNSGEIKWSYRSKLPALTIRGSSSPVIYENKVFASFDNGRLGVFQLSSGFTIWDGAISYMSGSSELENLIDSDSSPLIDNGLVYTTNYQGNLNIFDLVQKRSVWESEVSSFFQPLLIKGLVVVVESDSTIKSITSRTLEESWSSEEYRNRETSNATSFDNYIVIGDSEGYIHIIDPLNGKTVGRERLSKKPIKRIISRSNNFYVVDEGFNLYSLSI